MIYINVICDTPDCRRMQPVSFEKESETYGDIINELCRLGWGFNHAANKQSQDAETICSLCTSESVAETAERIAAANKEEGNTSDVE